VRKLSGTKLKIGVFVAVAVLLFAAINIYKARIKPLTAKNERYWIRADREILTLNEASILLESLLLNIKNRSSNYADLPRRLETDNRNRTVFITAALRSRPSISASGHGYGINPAVKDALMKAMAIIPPGSICTAIKLDISDIIFPGVRINDEWYIESPDYSRSLLGLAFDNSLFPAVSPDEIVSGNIVNERLRINIPYLSGLLGENIFKHSSLSSSGIHAVPFTTQSFYSNGNVTMRLFRGHRIFRDISAQDIIKSCMSAGSYLCSAAGPAGRFTYLYSAKDDREIDEYNLLRHCGTVFSMIELYSETGDKELLNTARRALLYINRFIVPFMGRKDALCVCGNGSVKLGGAGLALTAMSSYTTATQDMRYLRTMKKLARYIILEQKPDGSFVHMRSCPGFTERDFTSQYYPGEAMLGLLMLYEIDNDSLWLDAAELAARHSIRNKQESTEKDTPNDHWMVISIHRLLAHRFSIDYCKHALGIAESIIGTQRRNTEIPDWIGSYHDPPSSAASATRGEALVAAYRIARDYGCGSGCIFSHTINAEDILNALYLNTHFQLGCQFKQENSIYLPDPDRAAGGFKSGLDNYCVRIDYVQHNLSALLGFYRLISDYGLDLKRDPGRAKSLLEKVYQADIIIENIKSGR